MDKVLTCRSRTLALSGLVLAAIPAAHASTPPSDSEDVAFCRVVHSQEQQAFSASKPAALKAEDPRTVRMVYFRPNDRPFRSEVVDSMKTAILRIQAFYAAEMQRHGHGNPTFRFETDDQGEPLVHRVDGEHSDQQYLEKGHALVEVWGALGGRSPIEIEFVVIDYSTHSIPYFGGKRAAGVAHRRELDGQPSFGTVEVPGRFSWQTVAHELGHTFGLEHDFRDDRYIMSYGASDRARLSACAAEYLTVHPFFSPEIEIAREPSPSTIELISPPGYPAGSMSTPIRLDISNSAGLHQVLLFATTEPPHFAAGSAEVKAYRSFSGERSAVVEFDYDGLIPSDGRTSLANPIVHRMRFRTVDTAGRTSPLGFSLYQLSERHLATLDEPATITSLAFSPDGPTLASAAGDSLIRLWDLGTRETTASFGPAPPVWAVAISPDGATLASEHDGTVKLWEVATGTNTATLEGRQGHDPRYRSVAFSPPDGATLAVVSGDSTVRLWDLATGANYAGLDHDSHVTSFAFSPDGTRLAATSGDVVTLWNPATGERTALLEGHTHWVGAVAFSPDGATLASQSGWDGHVRLWDVRTQRGIADIKNTRGGHAVAFSPDGATLACASGQLVNLWDVGTLVRIDSLAHGTRVEVVAFSPDGKTLASGTWKAIELWDASEWLKSRPHELVKISGDGQEGAPEAPLENPLVVEVRDQYGQGFPGAPVTFAVTEGDGRLEGRLTVSNTETDAEGRAVGVLTLGTTLGTTAVEARLLGGDPVTFGAVAVEVPVPPIADGDPPTWHLPGRATVRLGKGSLGTGSVPVAFSPDGQRLAVATSIGIWLYDVATARELSLLPDSWVTSAAFSPDGGTLAAGSGSTLKLWDVARGEIAAALYGHDGAVRSVAFSSDGAILASASGSSVKLWDTASAENTATIDGSVCAIAFSPDNTNLAVASGKKVRFWDIADGVFWMTLGDRTCSFALSPDGTTIATGSRSTVKLWRRSTTTLSRHTGEVNSVAFSPDGGILASGSSDETARLWDVTTERTVATLDHSAPVLSVVFSPDGTTLLSISDDILLWDISLERAVPIQGHTLGMNSVDLSPDGATLAVGSANWTRLLDVRAGANTATVESTGEVNSVAFSPDGAILAIGDDRITLWDVARSQGIGIFEGPSTPVLSTAFSPRGGVLAAGDSEGTITLWDVATAGPIATLEGHTRAVGSLSFGPDGAVLASGSADGTARVWDLETRQGIATLEGHWGAVQVAFSPDATLATGSRDVTVRLWDMETWKEIAYLAGHPGGVHSVAFSPDGAILAAGSKDGPVLMWDTETRRRVATFEGHNADIRSLDFFPDGSTLASGSRDGTVLLWDLTLEPQALTILSGDAQEGQPGALLPHSLVVEVRDENGELLAGAQVTFTVTGGGGSLTEESVATDSRGRAATTLTLGSEPGPNTVEVIVQGLESMLFTVTARATPDFDGDGEVGFSDFFLFAEAFGGSDPRFDLDASGSVDFADFFLFAEHFGQPARAKLMALAREMIGLPEGPQLQQNWPNPFNSETVITWFLLRPGPARLEVFAVTGQRVAVLSRGPHEAGLHRLRWDGRDDQGRPLASGTYLYRLVTAEKVWARKFVLIR